MPVVQIVNQAYDITYRLAEVYWMGTLVTCFFAACSLVPTTVALISNYEKLPYIIRTQWTIIVPQWWVAINYFSIDLWNLTRASGGELRSGPWCMVTAFSSIFWALTGRQYWALSAFATYRVAKGAPIPAKILEALNIGIWVFGVVFASLFVGQYGPYKGLYCCITEDSYKPYATFPCFFCTFGGFMICMYYYYEAMDALRVNAKAATYQTKILVSGGMAMAVVYYFMWSIIIGAGFFTACGGQVPAYMDVLGGWMVKCLPILHGIILRDTIYKLANKPKSEEGP